MKKILSGGVIGMLFLAWLPTANAAVKDEVAERLKKVGEVCVQGDDCASESAGAATASASAGGASPESIYDQSCATCHAVGVAGAPKFADTDAWAPRIAQGMDVLYGSVINGKPPGMPAKGMCFTCSEDELKAVTDYMVSAAE